MVGRSYANQGRGSAAAAKRKAESAAARAKYAVSEKAATARESYVRSTGSSATSTYTGSGGQTVTITTTPTGETTTTSTPKQTPIRNNSLKSQLETKQTSQQLNTKATSQKDLLSSPQSLKTQLNPQTSTSQKNILSGTSLDPNRKIYGVGITYKQAQEDSKRREEQNKLSKIKYKINLIKEPLGGYNPIAPLAKKQEETGNTPDKTEILREGIGSGLKIYKTGLTGVLGTGVGVSTGIAFGAGVAAIGSASASVGTTAATSLGLSTSAASTAGSITGFIGGASAVVGTSYAVPKSSLKISEYTAPKNQQTVMDKIDFKKLMQESYKGETSSLGDKSTARKLISQYVPGGTYFFGDEKAFTDTTRKNLKSQGLNEMEIESGVSLALRQRKVGSYAEVGTLLLTNIGSEAIGQQLVTRSFSNTQKAITTSYPKIRTFLKTGSLIAPAGAVEGGSISIASQQSKYKDNDWEQTSKYALTGAISAGLIGGTIPALQSSNKIKTRKAGKAVEYLSYITDPAEKPGDIFAAQGASLLSESGKIPRIVVPTITSSVDIFGKTKVKFDVEFPNQFKPPKQRGLEGYKPPKIPDYIPSQKTTKSGDEILPKIPTITETPTKRGGGTSTIIPTKSNVPIEPNIPVPVEPNTPVPVDINTPINIPTITETPTRTELPTRINTPTKTPVNVAVPFPWLPVSGLFLPGGGSGRGSSGSGKGKFGYTPSFSALYFNIKGKSPSKMFGNYFSGQEFRPIISGKSESKTRSIKTKVRSKKTKTKNNKNKFKPFKLKKKKDDEFNFKMPRFGKMVAI